MPIDSHAPPSDLDIPAARAAAALYRTGLARGLPEARAWAEAADLFALAHPAWPMPLTEREAARTVGALIARDRVGRTAPPRLVPPGSLLYRLAEPVIPGAEPITPDSAPAPAPPNRVPPQDLRRDLPSRRALSPPPLSPFLASAPGRAILGAAPC